ncbi:MAG: hypothetical protein RBQ80_08390, partial [Methanocorpusculum sp.]|nr:hypothetical protein [Methanocorpusculum sp.]
IHVPRGSVFARVVYSARMAEKVSICDSIGCGKYIMCLNNAKSVFEDNWDFLLRFICQNISENDTIGMHYL